MPERPCYKHVCYPQDDAPYYIWEERFQFDKCCQHNDHDIVYGTENVINDDKACTKDVVRCQMPQGSDNPLEAVIEVCTIENVNCMKIECFGTNICFRLENQLAVGITATKLVLERL